MKLKQCILALVAVLSSFALTTYALVAVESDDNVAKIGSVAYSTFGEAMTAANGMTGDVTVEIYGPVEFVDGMELNGNYTSIKFVGKDSDAQMTIKQTAGGDYLTAHGKTVTFVDLSLAKANPAWSGNSGHMGNYFSVQGGEVTYEGCTFPNGACTNGGTALYSGCTFQNASEYGLWVYDDALVTVDGGTIDSKKGIKVYSEDENTVTSTLTVKNATFTANVTSKPAVAVGYAASVTLIGNTYSNTTAHIELDSGSDANCEGVTLVAQDAEGNDIASTLKVTDRNKSQAACGVLVDGKIYTSATTAAEAATAGSNVTLLYESSETVEFAEGVTLDKNGFTANGVTVTVVAPVSVTTFDELKAAVEAGKSVILANDITTTAAIVTAGVTSEIDLNGKTLTIGAGDNKFNDASNVTIKNGTIDITGLTVNGNAAFCLDEYETTLVTTVTLNDVNVVGNGYSSAYGIFYIGKSSVLNVNGGEWNLANDTFAAGGVFKADASSAKLNIDGLKLTAHNVRRGVTYAATTIANSTIAFSGDADGVDAEMEHGFNRSPLAITNSTITMTDMVGRGITAENGAVTISENSTVTMTNCQEATIDVRNGQTVTVDNTSTVTVDAEPTISSGNINGTVTVTTAGVAKIGEVEYKTLQAAIDAAQNGETITLVADVELSSSVEVSGKAVTLDLGEYTILDKSTAVLTPESNIWGLIEVKNNADITICGNGTIKCNYANVAGGWTGMAYAVNVDATSKLTVNSGNFINGNGGIQARGEVVVNGGTFVSHNGGTCIMAVDSDAKVTINGGSFKDAVETSDAYTGSGAVWGGFGATIEINGGTYDFAADPENGNVVWTLFPAQNAIAGNGENANMIVKGGTFVNFNPATDVVVDYSQSAGFTMGGVVADGYAALPDLNGNYVAGVAPSATVTNLGERVVAAGDYSVYPNGETTEDLNLPFVMQFTANHTKEQAASTPFGKWYGDFVVSFDGFENGGFTADGCYLVGNYGSFGWIKVPVDGMEIKNGDRFPIMLSLVNGAQTYEGICDYVKEFLCALYLTPEIVNANPNLKVTLELDVVENSDEAYDALKNGTNIYQVASYDYTASDFAAPVAKIGEVEYKTLQAAIDAAQVGETITVLRNITLTEGVTVAADDEITLNLNGMTISQEKECTASYQMIQNNGSLTITGDGKISFKDTSAGDSSFGWGSYTINNRGTLVVENGTIEHLGEQAFATHMICAIQQGAGSTTINGGLISTPNYRSVRINAGSLTINGGELDGQVWLQPNQGDATLAVTGGTFAPNGRDASSIFMTNTGENNTVSGASISGGTFTTKIGCSDASKLAGTISGGSFSEAAVSGTNTDLLVAGYEFETEADANGYYGIEWTGNVDELVIVDGELTEFVNEQEMTIGKLTYKRTLSSESYNALYVPFEIPVDSLSDNYDVFYIYDVRSYDNDEDGTPDDWDMEVFKFNKGTLKANYPYFIRSKSTAALDMVLTLEDATLCKSEEKSVVCSSVFMTYEVKGLYHKVESGELYGHYGISNKGRWIPIRNAVLSPFRFHLKMTNNDGSSVNVSEEALSSMRIRVIGEGSTTDIGHLKQESNRPAEIYDMQGRRVQTPAKGFYIVNGKKVYIK